MARCPFATWRPLPENATEPRRSGPAVIIDHSIVGSAEGAYDGFERESNPLESHFIVDLDGEIIQLIDTDRTADANYHANPFAISIETADRGDPDTQPWTYEQLVSLVRLHHWLAETHNVPRRQCPAWDEGGLGYHTLFGAPSHWTPVAKSCPGRARIKQWNEILLPAFIAGRADLERTGLMYVCKKGDKGDAVGLLQQTLRDLGADLKVDEEYGDATAAAVTQVMGWDNGNFVTPFRCRRIENKLIDHRVVLRLDQHRRRDAHAEPGEVPQHEHTFKVTVA